MGETGSVEKEWPPFDGDQYDRVLSDEADVEVMEGWWFPLSPSKFDACNRSFGATIIGSLLGVLMTSLTTVGFALVLQQSATPLHLLLWLLLFLIVGAFTRTMLRTLLRVYRIQKVEHRRVEGLTHTTYYRRAPLRVRIRWTLNRLRRSAPADDETV